jgi:GNAT superfamily N-acetyltransferase
MNLNFPQAVQDDAESLVALRIAAMRESLERIGRFDPQRARDRFLSGFSPEHTWHIEHDGQRMGFFVLNPDGDALLLDHLYVHPDHQGLGIGSRALGHVFAEADRQARLLRVGALKGSDSNRFYRRHGFRLVDESEFDNHYERSPA